MKTVWLPIFACLLVVFCLVWTGCETNSASDISVSISPVSTELHKGQSQEFTAAGAESYSWTLNPDSYGVLNRTRGPSVVYTSTANVSTTVVLKAYGTLGSSGVTNTASIVHVGG